ncbi:MAG: amidohydrolase family protein [Dehalococcoidales bacterium]
MRIDIVNGSIVTGDGESLLENTSVIIKESLIAELPRVKYVPYNAYADKVINAEGGVIIPGVINIHAHGITFGPFFPYAWKKLSQERILANLDTHLLQGTTSILSTDGFNLPSEVDAVNKIHPVNVKTCTEHTPENIRAAELIAGEGLEEWHRKFTAEEAVASGAIAIGEVGSPGTSYGTAEKEKKTGKAISAQHALALDEAVLAGNEGEIGKALVAAGLEKMTVAEAKKLVEETSVIPIAVCCDAIRESASYVKKLGIPVLVHAEPGMKEAILQTAKEVGSKLIALHVNHSFTVDESVKLARELKSLGAVVEIITADSFGAKQLEPSPESTFTLLKEDLVDVITTDFIGGYHDPILLVLQKAIEEGVLALPRAIQLATSAAARIIPGVAPNRGLIEPGKVADLCIVERDDISKVKYVIIAGRVVVEDGRIVV